MATSYRGLPVFAKRFHDSLSIPWNFSRKAFSKTDSSSVTTMPPSPVVMFLLGWKEKTEVVGKDPMRRPLYSAPTALADVVDRDDRLRAGTDLFLDLLHANVQSRGVDVGEDGNGAAVDDRVQRGDEGHRRRDHFVSGPDLQGHQRHVEPGRGGRDGNGEAPADVIGEGRGELLDLRPGRDPPRSQRVGDFRHFGLAQARPSKGEKGVSHGWDKDYRF